MTADLILESQVGNDNATLLLVEKFNPLLKKYSFKLFYEDAYNDLLTDFLELVHSIQIEAIASKDEGRIISYISASIHNCYVKRLIEMHRRLNCQRFSDLGEGELYYIEVTYSTCDTYQDYDIFSVKALTKPEKSVINMIYYLGYTPTEISKIIGISRQAVNQMKNRALKKLKTLYSDKP
jgi:DNA-directed RNA polymerase specialized sigma subunit, sigma24 homolog